MPETLSIAALVPPAVAVAEIAGPCEEAVLLPDEEVALGRVGDKRRRDFTLGRHCAREALRALGADSAAILPGPSRQPLWPSGACGSITHCRGYTAAVAAFQSHVRSIGIDAEQIQPLEDGVRELVSHESERAWSERAGSSVPWDVLLFSAKESVFKAWFPITGLWLNFEEARVEFFPASGEFRAAILHEAAAAHGLSVIGGRYAAGEDRVLTSALVPA